MDSWGPGPLREEGLAHSHSPGNANHGTRYSKAWRLPPFATIRACILLNENEGDQPRVAAGLTASA